MKKLIFLLLFPVLSFGQMARVDSSFQGVRFIEYYPTHQKPEGIIFYLHGLGEIGTNLDELTVNEIPRLIEAGAEYPYIIICPQVDKGTTWPKNFILTCIKIIDGYKITPRHIAGLSLGARGTYDAVRYAPRGFFKTACIVTGKTSTYDSVKWSGTKWLIYHGTQDKTFPISFDRKVYQYLLKIKVDVTMKEFNVGHKIWPIAFRDNEYWEWLKPKSIFSGFIMGGQGGTITN